MEMCTKYIYIILNAYIIIMHIMQNTAIEYDCLDQK
jgi:hypothetical protein